MGYQVTLHRRSKPTNANLKSTSRLPFEAPAALLLLDLGAGDARDCTRRRLRLRSAGLRRGHEAAGGDAFIRVITMIITLLIILHGRDRNRGYARSAKGRARRGQGASLF